MALASLPSLGASTGVPGAAGLSTLVAGSANPTLDITVPYGENNPASGFENTFKKLWGYAPGELLEKAVKDKAANNGSGGSEVIDAPVSVSGNLDDLIKWVQENAALLIVLGIVVLLAFYGLSAATRR